MRLNSLNVEDQRVRQAIQRAKRGPNPPPEDVIDGMWAEQVRADSLLLLDLDQIVQARGWPGTSLAGETGALAAFLIVQHAPLAAQERYLPRIEAEVRAGEAEPWHLAYVTDRVRLNNGLGQLYGTQPNQPIHDEPNLGARRAALGMD